MKFIHLHVHSHFSLLDGLTKFDELVQTVKNDGADAVALTDHGVMYGTIEFYKKCKKAGIKPILGLEAYLAKTNRFDKTAPKDDEKRNYHLILLARDLEGYHNLIKLTSIAHLEGYYYKPRVDWDALQKHSAGLIACTACLGGEIPQLLLSGRREEAVKRALEYEQLFGKDNFYLEIQPHPDIPEQDKVNRQLIEISQETGIPLVATNDMHYLRQEDFDAQDILLCLQTKTTKNDPKRFSLHGKDFYYKTAEEMYVACKDYPQEALENTIKIAERCNVELKLGDTQLPYFQVPEGHTEQSYLEELTRAGTLKRYGRQYEEVDASIQERMNYELSVIAKMGWPSYFLIVADFVNWAKDNGIVVGPGRGSAAGSLVCYLLGITNLDPLQYDLLFERFLNPDRISMPDIDLDFADARRDEVLEYVAQKYGRDHVAQIITFGTMAARAAIRDVGRVLNEPYDYCDKLAKLVPMFTNLEDALETAELKDFYNKEPAARRIIEYARRLEGVARHASTHACGVLITKNPLTDYVPLQYASRENAKKKGSKKDGEEVQRSVVSQYSLSPVEDLGLLKMDFLGLKNLTIIESAIKIIKQTVGTEVDIDKIPLDDVNSYKLFQDGETTGVFQFESSGMKRYLKDLKPTEFEDIIAMVALYRPGPMEWIPEYISGKHGRKKLSYLHPKLEPILKKTYGVAIYQEQVMQMARDLAGFTMAQADVLRKAMGKKIPELLAEQKKKFIDGCVAENIDAALAEKIFSFIEPFAGYGFNRSHAACYAMIGYQTAYLKASYPAEFMAALLTSDQGDIDRVAIEVEECREMGIEVTQPDVNQSFESFTVVSGEDGKKTVRFGLKAIKNVGGHIAEVIIAERVKNGQFADLSDFLERVDDKDLNKKSLESLIKCGALDSFGERGKLLANLDGLLAFSKDLSKQKESNQNSLFGGAGGGESAKLKVKLTVEGEVGRQEKLSWEKDLLGLYLTEHPYLDYKKHLEDLVVPLRDVSQIPNERMIAVAGIITLIKKINTRKGDTMLFVKIEDNVANLEILVFPKTYKATIDIWVEGRTIACFGKKSDKDNEMKLLAEKPFALDLEKIITQKDELKSAVNAYAQKGGLVRPRQASTPLKIIVKQECAPDELENLHQVLLANQGRDAVYLKVFSVNGPKIIKTNLLVDNQNGLSEKIRAQFGGVEVAK